MRSLEELEKYTEEKEKEEVKNNPNLDIIYSDLTDNISKLSEVVASLSDLMIKVNEEKEPKKEEVEEVEEKKEDITFEEVEEKEL